MFLAAIKDYKLHLLSQTVVEARIWFCHKTRPKVYIKSHEWNRTLHQMPGLTRHPYFGKPIEAIFTYSDRLVVPYSKEVAKLKIHNWVNKEDTLCVFIDDIPSICNLFRGCWFWWPFIVPLKALVFVFGINIHKN